MSRTGLQAKLVAAYAAVRSEGQAWLPMVSFQTRGSLPAAAEQLHEPERPTAAAVGYPPRFARRRPVMQSVGRH